MRNKKKKYEELFKKRAKFLFIFFIISLVIFVISLLLDTESVTLSAISFLGMFLVPFSWFILWVGYKYGKSDSDSFRLIKEEKIEQKNKIKKDVKVFSVNQIDMGTVLGGPIAGMLLLGENSKKVKLKYFALMKILAMIFVILPFIVTSPTEVDIFLLNIVFAFIQKAYYKKLKFSEIKEEDKASSWRVFLNIIAGRIISISLVLIIVFLKKVI